MATSEVLRVPSIPERRPDTPTVTMRPKKGAETESKKIAGLRERRTEAVRQAVLETILETDELVLPS